MKKLLLSICATILFISFSHATLAQYTEWEIAEFNQDIQIQEDGKVLITETIVADYTNQARRGPIRAIPINYDDNFGNPFNVRFNLISVKDENGNDHPVNKIYEEYDDINIRIGESDVYLNEITTYVLTYEFERVIGYFDEHDELYLNIYTEWDVPVLSSEVVIHLPSNGTLDNMMATCYTGYYGDSNDECTSEIIDEKTFKFDLIEYSEAYEGFTIVAGFDKGIVIQPSASQQFLWWLIDNWSLLIPIFVFLFLYLRWWYTGRDPKTNKDTIIPRYNPPEGLTPTEVGTLIDESADITDIVTVIVDYAVKGYIKIVEIKKKKLFGNNYDYQLIKLKDYKTAKGIKKFELEILNNIFGTKEKLLISSLKYKFYKKLSTIKTTLYKSLISSGLFVHNPENIRLIYFGIGGFITGGSFFLSGLIYELFGLTMVFALIASGILFVSFAKFMPKKTLKGAKTYIEILGLEEYIRTAEKDRIKFQENQNEFFEKLLPYAMVLGLADKWGETFKDLYTKPPSWFLASDISHFDSSYLINRLTKFSSSTNTAFASAPRSSGGSSGGSSSWTGGSGFSGGFSGGGFGGGGGSSW